MLLPPPFSSPCVCTAGLVGLTGSKDGFWQSLTMFGLFFILGLYILLGRPFTARSANNIEGFTLLMESLVRLLPRALSGEGGSSCRCCCCWCCCC